MVDYEEIIKQRLDNENPDWTKIVFKKTGVLFKYRDGFELWTINGYFDLYDLYDDNITDKDFASSINSTDDLIAAVLSSSAYSKLFSNQEINNFTLSKLYANLVWNLWIPTSKSSTEIFGKEAEHLNIKNVVTNENCWHHDLFDKPGEYRNCIVVYFDFVERDESYVSIPLSEELTFADTMDYIKNHLMICSDHSIDESAIDIDVCLTEEPVSIPETYEDMEMLISKVYELRNFKF